MATAENVALPFATDASTAQLGERVQERRRREAFLRALHEELSALCVTIENERRAAEDCERKAEDSPHPIEERQKALAHRERLGHSAARVPEIEEEIARLRAVLELGRLP